MKEIFAAWSNNIQKHKMLDSNGVAFNSMQQLLMGSDFGFKDSDNSSYIQPTGDQSSSPGSPMPKLAELGVLDKLSALNSREYKEENGDGRPEPDTKDESLVSLRDNQESISLAESRPEVQVPKEKKRLKPTSSCYYYQQTNTGSSAVIQRAADDLGFDKKSLNLDLGSKVTVAPEESTKSVKNLVITSSKRKNTETMHSPQVECLSGGTSELSNLNFPKLDINAGIDSPISSRSTELVKTKSNRDKNEKGQWRNNESEKMHHKGGDEKAKMDYYKADHSKKFINSPKHHHAKKRGQNAQEKGGSNQAQGGHKFGSPVNGFSGGNSYLTDKHFPTLEEANYPKPVAKKAEPLEKTEKMPLGLIHSSEGKKKKKGDKKPKK